MILSAYDKIHTLRDDCEVSNESPEKLGFENDTYMRYVDGDTTSFLVYQENPLPARFCIEDLSKKFFTCIGLFEPVYYFHDIYQGVLDKDQKEKVNKFLNTKLKYLDISPWNLMLGQWKIIMNDQGIKIPEYESIQPDYTLLPDMDIDHPATFNLQIKYK